MDRNWVIIPDWKNLDSSVSIAKEYNLKFEYNDFFWPTVYMNPEEVEKRIEKYLSLDRDRSMDTLHGVFYDISPISTDPIIRNHSLDLMNQSMSIANRLGVRGVVFHSSIISGLRLKSYQNNWLRETEYVFRDLCSKYPNLEIYLENTTEQEPDLLVEMAKRMSDVVNFKLCLDYAHANLTNTSLDIWVKEFSPYLGHIHLNDNNGIEDLHQVPGTGSIDYKKFKELSDKYFNNIPILLEVNGTDKAIDSVTYMKNI